MSRGTTLLLPLLPTSRRKIRLATPIAVALVGLAQVTTSATAHADDATRGAPDPVAEKGAPPRILADPTPPAPPGVDPRREVEFALGYGSLIAPRGIVVSTATDTAERRAALDGFSVDVVRRLASFGYGARFWHMGGSSNGRGASAHLLTRVAAQARLYPWTLRTLEPWIGSELGVALAEDFAIWDKTDKEAAHRAVSGVRPALVAGLEAGALWRVATPLAFGLRGGILYMGFDRAGGPVAESPQAANFFVQPIDYGRKLWLSVALTAELTVSD